ncbi:MarR family winged helix-turn-helix transcriptional regulator [Actinomadura sp. WMMB 499]|uniref:MarR family winged helix-turn-helix transcriptional regulator n=1 Tax=Actinomadura sp. WMMB 499 TaxID=1219491 RepID=UPI001243C4C2|nr:MarR family winged helix-turn-helix transcriptional regulator [Actinomadura sp. WMMB 499]QFG24091.1 winged helix-turn-helix transcriptional regulator [Actinomadura sp. WMMB 499]
MSTQADAGTDEVAVELSGLVFEVTGRLRAQFNAAAAELDLPPAQALVLVNLSAPAPMRHLADWLSCEPSNVTGIVDGLERRGLVTRRPAAGDRRVKHVVLTETGERRRDRLRSSSQALASTLFALPGSDQRHLRDLLARVLGRPPAEADTATT